MNHKSLLINKISKLFPVIDLKYPAGIVDKDAETNDSGISISGGYDCLYATFPNIDTAVEKLSGYFNKDVYSDAIGIYDVFFDEPPIKKFGKDLPDVVWVRFSRLPDYKIIRL